MIKKTVFMALVTLFTLSITLQAQNNNRRSDNQKNRSSVRWSAKDRAENMSKQLNLTSEEKAKVQTFFEQQDAKRKEQIAALREKRESKAQDQKNRREEMRASREKAIAEEDAALETIIGQEKMAQWKKYREERQNEMRKSNRQGRRSNR